MPIYAMKVIQDAILLRKYFLSMVIVISIFNVAVAVLVFVAFRHHHEHVVTTTKVITAMVMVEEEEGKCFFGF